MQEQTLSLTQFRSGLITRQPSNLIPDDSFSEVQNIILDDKFLPIKDRGHQKYNWDSIGNAPIRGAGVYTMTDGTKYYIVACGGKLYYSVAGSGTWTAYKIGGVDLTIHPDSDVEMVQYLNSMWIVNGKYPIITNSGYANSKMIKINGTTVTSITAEGVPEGGKYIIVHQERLFIAGTPTNPNGLYWSEPYEPEDWQPTYGLNYDFVGKDDGEIITGIKSYQGYIYVGKPRHIYRYLTGGDITEWQSQKVDTKLGWLYQRTVQEFFGFLIYLSPEGVVLFNGNDARLVSEQIQPDILNLPQLKSAFAGQWVYNTTNDFNLGIFGNLIDTSNDELKLKPQASQADWQAGIVNDVDIKTVPGSIIYVTPSALPGFAGIGCALVKLGNYIYALRGGTTTDFLRYSILDGTWVYKRSTPNFVSFGGSLATDGQYIYALRGGGTTDFWRYDVNRDEWEAMAPIPNIVSYGASLVGIPNGSYLFATVGGGVSGVGNKFYRYNPSNNSWEERAGLSGYVVGRGGNLVCVSNEHIFLLHGNYTQSFWRYSISGNSWMMMDNFPISVGSYSAITYDGTYIYVGVYTLFYRYNISENSWSLCTDLPYSLHNNDGEFVYDGTYIYLLTHAYFRRYSIRKDSWTLNPYFITRTLDFNTSNPYGNPPVYGHLAVEMTGTITFQRKSAFDNDPPDSVWEESSGWSSSFANGSEIPGPPYRYLRIKCNMSGNSSIKQIYVGAVFQSAKKQLSQVPTSWGTFESQYVLNNQIVTFWMRTAPSESGLGTATYYQQTPGGIITAPLNQWIQFEVRMDTTLFSQIPVVDNVVVNYNIGSAMPTPCSVVWRNDYWLNVSEAGQTINNVVYKYNKAGYWLKRTNKKNNIYFIDENKLLSGTSESNGFVRYNDIGTKDDTDNIDSFFVTKNFELAPMIKLFKECFITSKSNANWTLSYSIDNGDYRDITIEAQSNPETMKKLFSGIVNGRFIKFRIRQNAEDSAFEFHGLQLVYALLRALNPV